MPGNGSGFLCLLPNSIGSFTREGKRNWFGGLGNGFHLRQLERHARTELPGALNDAAQKGREELLASGFFSGSESAQELKQLISGCLSHFPQQRDLG
jgi:hypothetical protein